MTPSAISICSNALLLLGHQPITSFEEGSAGAQIAAALYDSSYEALLTQTRWHFATKQAQLAMLADKPLDRWSYAFQLPADLLLISRITERHYEIYEDMIYTNAKEVNIEYIYRVEEANLPTYFVKALEFYLAAQFAIPITSNTQRAEQYQNMYLMQIRQARNADSAQRPNYPIEDSPFTDVRYG